MAPLGVEKEPPNGAFIRLLQNLTQIFLPLITCSGLETPSNLGVSTLIKVCQLAPLLCGVILTLVAPLDLICDIQI